MLRPLSSPQVHHHHSRQSTKTLLLPPCHFFSGDHGAAHYFPVGIINDPILARRRTTNAGSCRHGCSQISAAAAGANSSAAGDEEDEDSSGAESVRALVSVKQSSLGLERGLDYVTDLFCRTRILLELVAAELLDHRSGLERPTIKGYCRRTSSDDGEVYYESNFTVPDGFGAIGAVLVENGRHKEMFIKQVVIEGFPGGPLNFTCDSWIHSKFDNHEKRIFFTSKSYLPFQTPGGLRKYREKELISLRGDGLGQRKTCERIYDYDVYNDLGDPDDDRARPVLGGKMNPFPRRCRTGRPRSNKDQFSETRVWGDFYVPRDEAFSEEKNLTLSPANAKTAYSSMHNVVPCLERNLIDTEQGFPYYSAIDSLFNEGIQLPVLHGVFLGGFLRQIIIWAGKDVLRFETPNMINRDKFSWLRDDEFARQTLAGMNPCSIQLVTEWPLKSKLNPDVYGPQESAITKEVVELQIRGHLTLQEAIEQKKLFILDYHDLLLPYVNKVRKIKGTTLYGSRTLFFLTPDGTLRPLAIELTRPPEGEQKPQWKRVFTPCWDATGICLWRLAKAHVLAHDSGYHQLVTHWLRTHCATEPYIIATKRQLSGMHPIYRLINPHFRYTMKINAIARQILISADGIIETAFSPRRFSLELCSHAYHHLWRFDHQALPADLLSRGMAVEDPNAPHGLKLTIEDYPYASDGLVLWDAIKQWVSDYVNHYYPQASQVNSDHELQAWWTEIRTVGHGDKKDEAWWPVLATQDDLIGVLTTMIWITSGHHAAVNFGQYDFAGYIPNRPTIARRKMPVEDAPPEEVKRFLERPERALLECFPSQFQATKIMAILDVLSSHSLDEEYIGQEIQPSWAEDQVIEAAFRRFNRKLKDLEQIIDDRNEDERLKNRSGAGIAPYTLLKPSSRPGVTGQGVPNSISI